MITLQVEIDEFQNYEKALGAMNEAARCLGKVVTPREPTQHRRALEIVQSRMANIKRFVDIKRLFERGEQHAGLTQCQNLLLTGGEDLEQSVRRGDVYALMIQTAIKLGDFDSARKYVTDLQTLLTKYTNSSITYYLSKEVLETLAKGLDVPISTLVPHQSEPNLTEDNEEVIQEELMNE